MNNLECAGYPAVLHIHDDIIGEVKKGTGSFEECKEIMGVHATVVP